MLRELVVQLLDSVPRSFLVLFLEGWTAADELICQDAKAPYVNPVVIGIVATGKHLRRKVVAGSAQGFAPLRRSMDAPAEISKLDHSIAVEKVLRLQVSVNHIFGVHICKGVNHLCDDVRCLLLRVRSLASQVSE